MNEVKQCTNFIEFICKLYFTFELGYKMKVYTLMVNKSIYINKMTQTHFSPQNHRTQRRSRHTALEISVLARDRYKTKAGLNLSIIS